MGGPTRGAKEKEQKGWTASPRLAFVVRVGLFIAPLACAWLIVRILSSSFYQPEGGWASWIWLVQAIVLGSSVAMLVDKVAVRFLPLVTLLGLSLTFPDQAPSRFSLALRTGTVRRLTDRLETAAAEGLSDDISVAAEQAIELVTLLGQHERLTRGHTERVRAYTELIADELKLSRDDREKLAWAALLHDIGKLTVPAEILNKDGQPTPQEWEILQGHPAAGEDFLAPLAAWLSPWHKATAEHHERWDGDGYPRQLSRTDISLAGRIVAVADAYDVITSKRSYKEPMTAEAARRELVACSGKQFDPEVVRAMLSVSIGKRRTGARFAWMLEIPGISHLLHGASGIPAATLAGVVAVGSIASGGIPTTTSIPDNLALVAEETADETPVETQLAEQQPTATSSAVEAGTDVDSPIVTASPGTTIAPNTSPGPTDTASTAPSPSSTEPLAPTSQTSPSTTAASSTTQTTPSGLACENLHAGETTLVDADLSFCDFGEGTFDGLDMARANLYGANVTNATLTNFSLTDANIETADFSGAVLFQGSLARVRAAGLIAPNISVDSVDLTDADFTDADFDGGDFTDLSFNMSVLTNADFDDVVFVNVSFIDTIMTGAKFRRVAMSGAHLFRADATDTDFRYADLTQALLHDANFTGARLDNATVVQAEVDRVRFSDALFEGTNFTGATGTPTDSGTATYEDTICPDGVGGSTPCWP